VNADCLLSILIPTLQSRQVLYNRLRGDLEAQMGDTGLTAEVEILTERDDGAASVGDKRNRLMDRARGQFIVFVDDDDRVSPDYVRRIIEAIRNSPAADCICFTGEITFRGSHPRRLLHSIGHTDWLEQGGDYLRPPCHIMPIRRNIAVRYRFMPVDYSEDMDWAIRMSHDRALRSEVIIDEVLYHYDSRRHYAWQWILDKTQAARHALGLRFVSRLALQQRLSAFFRGSRT